MSISSSSNSSMLSSTDCPGNSDYRRQSPLTRMHSQLRPETVNYLLARANYSDIFIAVKREFRRSETLYISDEEAEVIGKMLRENPLFFREITHLSVCGISSRGVKALAAVPSITSFDFCPNQYAIEEEIEALSTSKTISQLSLCFCRINLSSLSSLTSLTALDLSRVNVDRKVIFSLAANHRLTHLNLRNSPVDDEIAKAFGKNKSLTSLILSRVNDVRGGITSRGADALADNTYLRVLGLEGHWLIGDKGANNLARMKKLQRLDLSFAGLSFEATTGLANHASLTHLTLNDNHWIMSIGAFPFKWNKILTHLDVASCSIDDTGAEYICECPSITTLNMAKNDLTAIGAQALAERCFTTLDVSDNPQIGEEGVRALAYCPSLCSLKIRGINMGNAVEIFAQNNTLRCLHASLNPGQAASIIKNNYLTQVEITPLGYTVPEVEPIHYKIYKNLATLILWQQIVPLLCFQRANQAHPLRNSIISLNPDIMHFCSNDDFVKKFEEE